MGVRHNTLLDEDAGELDMFSFQNLDRHSKEGGATGMELLLPPKPPASIKIKKRQNGHNTSFSPALSLVCSDVLPAQFQNVFPFPSFNRMQSEAFSALWDSHRNIVVSAPTGSGKTVLFELAIIAAMKQLQDLSSFRAIYVAPTKTVCNEKFRLWKNKFSNLKVKLITSDTRSLANVLDDTNLVIMTPEKCDLLSRNRDIQNIFLHTLSLMLVDEVHSIKEERGAILEVIIMRLTLLSNTLRIIAVSGTIVNAKDLAKWLRARCFDGDEAECLEFDQTYRPVELKTIVHGYSCQSKNSYQLDSIFNRRLLTILKRYSKGKPTLVFCPTRRSTVVCAKFLGRSRPSKGTVLRRDFWSSMSEKSLREVAERGVAYHHAGLSYSDRSLVEQNYMNGNLKVLCCTSTLAVGINLPAYLVVIKGTEVASTLGVREYSAMEIMQMAGRAGRPQFEQEGCAIIMTENNHKDNYSSLAQGLECIESSLHKKLSEILCSEVNAGIIHTLDNALTWLKKSYFYSRLPENYDYYRCQDLHEIKRDVNIDAALTSVCRNLLDELVDAHVLQKLSETYSSTGYSTAMSAHSLSVQTIKEFISLPTQLGFNQIILLLPHLPEFGFVTIKASERKFYQAMSQPPTVISLPYTGKVAKEEWLRQRKIAILLQFKLGTSQLPESYQASNLVTSFYTDLSCVSDVAIRVLKGLRDCFAGNRDLISLRNVLMLVSSIRSKAGADTESSVKIAEVIQKGTLPPFAVERSSMLQRGVLSKAKRDNGILDFNSQAPITQTRKKPPFMFSISIRKVRHTTEAENWLLTAQTRKLYQSKGGKDEVLTLNILVARAPASFVALKRIHLEKQSNSISFITPCLKNSYGLLGVEITCEEMPGLQEIFYFPLDEHPERPRRLTSTCIEQCKPHIDEIHFSEGVERCGSENSLEDSFEGSSDDDDIIELFAQPTFICNAVYGAPRQRKETSESTLTETGIKNVSSLGARRNEVNKRTIILSVDKSTSQYGAVLVSRLRNEKDLKGLETGRPQESSEPSETRERSAEVKDVLYVSSQDSLDACNSQGLGTTDNDTSIAERHYKCCR